MSEEFRSAVEHPRLEPGAIHIWRVPITPTAHEAVELARCLAVDEQARAARFHFDVHRHAFIAARAALRRLLGRYAGISPEVVSFSYGPKGKPALAGAVETRGIEFNVSHRGGLALLAFTLDRAVGVDIEQLRDVPQARNIADKHFTPTEVQLLEAAFAGGQEQRCFFRLWTRKEAVIKAVGAGLSLPLNQFEVTMPGNAGSTWDTVRISPSVEMQPNSVWAVRDLELADGYCGALTVADSPAVVSFYCERPDRGAD